jgi:hypothetical protein
MLKPMNQRQPQLMSIWVHGVTGFTPRTRERLGIYQALSIQELKMAKIALCIGTISTTRINKYNGLTVIIQERILKVASVFTHPDSHTKFA